MKISQTVKKFAIVFITIFVCVVISFFSFVFVKSLSKDDELDLMIAVHYETDLFDMNRLKKHSVDYLFVNFYTQLGEQTANKG